MIHTGVKRMQSLFFYLQNTPVTDVNNMYDYYVILKGKEKANNWMEELNMFNDYILNTIIWYFQC